MRAMNFSNHRLPLAVHFASILLVTAAATALAQESDRLQRSPELGIGWRDGSRGPMVIAEVDPKGAAAKIGLMKGDMVITVNDEQVRSGAELAELVKKTAPGDEVVFEVRREGKTLTKTFVMPDSRVNMFGASLQEAGGEIVVSDVAPNTPAERAGLLKGDILLSMAGKRPDTLASLADFMSKLVAVDRSEKTNEPIEVTVQRRGEDKPVKLLVEREPAPMPARPAPRTPLPSRDLTLPNTRHLVLGVEVREQGPRVVVTQIMERKPADLAGIQPGDAIVGVGRKPINSHAALVSAIAPYEPGDEVPVEVMRGDKTAVVRVKVVNARPSEEDVVLAASTEVAAPPALQGQDQLTLAEEVRMLRARVDALEQVVKQLVQQLGQRQQR